MAVTATTDYGSDLSTFADVASGVADLDPTFTQKSGPIIVVERIARKLMTPTGSRLKQGWGYDLREVLQGSPTAAEVAQLRGIITDQILDEPEVSDVDFEIDYQLANRTMTLRGIITLVTDQEFPLVLVITPDAVQPIFEDISNPGAG